MLNFELPFETLFNRYLRDLENQLPDVDRAAGTLTAIEGTALMIAMWGLYNRLQHSYRQMWPDTAETAVLDRHAQLRGLSRQTGETDAALLVRLCSVLRQPPAGGNRYDWPRWAKETPAYNHTTWSELCRAAWVIENARGSGSINVPIYSDRTEVAAEYSDWANAHVYAAGDVVKDDSVTGVDRAYVALSAGTSSGTGVADDTGVTWEDCEEYPSDDLVAWVDTCIDAKRPVGIWDFIVYPVLKKVQPVTMTVTGADANAITIKEQIEAFMKSLTGGKTCYLVQLASVAIEAGAENAIVSLPAADVAVTWGPTSYQRIWPGLVTVTVV